MGNIRIFIAEPDRISRLGLQMILDHEPGMQVVGIGVQAEGLEEQAQAARPDVILLDWPLAAPSPAKLFGRLRETASQPSFIVFHVRPEIRPEVMASGADYFICKDAPPDQLLAILQQVKQSRFEQSNGDQ